MAEKFTIDKDGNSVMVKDAKKKEDKPKPEAEAKKDGKGDKKGDK